MTNTRKIIVLISTLFYSILSFAGGPLILEGPNGNTPVTYQNPDITVHIENGDLGTRTNDIADVLVQSAFGLWNNVNTSNVNLIIDEIQLELIDIDINNFDTYIPNIDGTIFNADDNLNPVVYDSDGKIIEAFFGSQSDLIIGFSASIYTARGSYFEEGYAVINGSIKLTDIELKLLIAHEIGHFFGLDHTQVDINNQESSDFPPFCSTSIPENYPLMYPFVCRNVESLHSDDISAVSALYPATNINDNFGILEGRFVDDSGTPILGANIWVENTVSGDSYSIVSDYLVQGTGYYRLYLPAGSYTLHANSINPEFNAGSGVGPYSLTTFDISFQCPHPIIPVTYQGDSDGSDELITLSANQTIQINFSVNGGLANVHISSDSDDDSFFEDLFGATSHITLFLLVALLVTGRLISIRSNHSRDKDK